MTSFTPLALGFCGGTHNLIYSKQTKHQYCVSTGHETMEEGDKERKKWVKWNTGRRRKTTKAWVTTRLCKNKPSPSKLSHLLRACLLAAVAVVGSGLTRAKGKGHRLWSICWLRASDTHLCRVRDLPAQQLKMEMNFNPCAFLSEQIPHVHVSWAERTYHTFGAVQFLHREQNQCPDILENWVRTGKKALMQCLPMFNLNYPH